MLEVVQNAWSFSIFYSGGGASSRQQEDSSSSSSSRGAIHNNKKRSTSPVPFSWRHSEHDHNDEHRLEDIFLDEVSDSGGPEDSYHFEDNSFPYKEEDAIDNANFMTGDLESFDDGDLLFGNERLSRSSDDLGP
jgi:hypothetical protein